MVPAYLESQSSQSDVDSTAEHWNKDDYKDTENLTQSASLHLRNLLALRSYKIDLAYFIGPKISRDSWRT
jgi:hypothetical protein